MESPLTTLAIGMNKDHQVEAEGVVVNIIDIQLRSSSHNGAWHPLARNHWAMEVRSSQIKDGRGSLRCRYCISRGRATTADISWALRESSEFAAPVKRIF